MNNKKYITFILIVIMTFIFMPKNTYAITSSDYYSRNKCNSKYELAKANKDETITHVACYNTYEEARNNMNSKNDDDLFIFDSTSSKTRIVDAKYALLDLSVNEETLTYFYETESLTTRKYTYMDTGSLYGGVDGALLAVNYKKSVKVKIGGLSAWIPENTYEIVPLNWVKSSSSYTVTDSIKHNYVSKIQNTYNGSKGSVIGPKPEQLSEGTYYSYDGHYFYKDLKTMIKDYKNGNYNNSVNKNNPYYNYYMYLSNHSKTTYSSLNIDEYIRNNMGISKNVYGDVSKENASRLYGQGMFFYYAQQKYGVNAILSLSLNRNESANGRSNLAINKNNGFGLNAVDSNPYQAANWFPTYSNSILEFAYKWITDGYADPSDSRYFGPVYGDKYIGMNVKYASDTYWSEKMAANYYSFDRSKGLQDYNYYQLGVVNNPTNAYKEASSLSQVVYTYPEKDDGVLIVDEISNSEGTWYKLQSDKIINGNTITTIGDYNWDSYVYVKKEQITKINNPKNNYQYPSKVTNYKDSKYNYNLYIDNATLKPKVAVTTKDVDYYYDSTLEQKTNNRLLKDKWIMVYGEAKDENNKVVSYLVTSDYKTDQKHWIPAGNFKFQTTGYGKVQVDISGAYTWVNSTPNDTKETLISGLYTYTYVPLLTSTNNEGYLWYKVPVSLTTNNNSYGWTIANCDNVNISLTMYYSDEDNKQLQTNNKPVINANNKSYIQGEKVDILKDVTAYDEEDKDLTNKIITKGEVNTDKPGEYEITYTVTDSQNETTSKTIQITIIENEKPVINATNKKIVINNKFNELENVTATDKEDGDLTDKIKVLENNIDITKIGEYKVTYSITDSYNQKITKTITVNVIEENKSEDISIDELLEKQRDGEFNLESLDFNKNTKKFSISGYLIISGIDNINKEYALVLVNKDNDEDIHIIDIDSWTSDVPYNLGTVNGYKYNDIWFKGDIDFSDVPNGDYDLYMYGESNSSFTIQLVDNFFGIDISRRGEDSNHGYNFKVRSDLRTQQIELNVRDELYTTSVSPTYRDMINEYDTITFRNNKMYIKGYSYNYNGTYNEQLSITRKLIFENNSTYKQEVYDLGSTKGLFEIKTKDNKDKTYAWYEKEIDLSKLEKGVYTLQVYTKTSDAEDYGEITDMFEELNESTTIGDKTYTVTYNKNKQDRLELTIK